MLDFTNKYPFFKGQGPQKIERMKHTIETWEKLKESGFQPYDCSSGLITMQLYQFKKAFNSKEVSVSRNRNFTIYSMWDSNGTEVCATFESDVKEFVKIKEM